MNLDELTLGQVKELKLLFGGSCQSVDGHPYEIGKAYFIRTVTHHFTGRLVEVFNQELVFEDVSWIADSGRYSDALKEDGKFSEVEPYPDGKVVIGRGSLIDASLFVRGLPREQK